jgi:hypothetical protein
MHWQTVVFALMVWVIGAWVLGLVLAKLCSLNDEEDER